MLLTNARSATLALPSQISSAVSALTMAFGSDPVCRYVWADPREYVTQFPEFVRAFGGEAFSRESAFVDRELHGAALWLPPAAGPDEAALVSLVEAIESESVRSTMFGLLDAMGAHHPEGAHWYLPLIGVEPLAQSRGIGRILMQPVLDRCDASGLPAYLESTNPKNVPFYERLGFRAVGCIEVGECPPIVPMLRKPVQA